MRKRDIIKKEPLVSIGLVLPKDKQKKITVTNNINKKKHKIIIKNNQLFMNDVQTDFIELKDIGESSYYTIDSVIAGRGFHWQKRIIISIHGKLVIRRKGGYLFLINILGLESYLMCVATSEMNAECPSALLEAQTIAARSWMVASSEDKHRDLGLDACNDDCCQRYQGLNGLNDRAKIATMSTKGIFLTYNKKICDARYSKSCGGITENNENVWGDEPKPYLRSIYDGKSNSVPDLSNDSVLLKWFSNDNDCFCSNNSVNINKLKKYLGLVDDQGNYSRWKITYSMKQLVRMVNKSLNQNLEMIKSVKIERRGKSGRAIELIIYGIRNDECIQIRLTSEYEIRRVFHPKFLYSSAFIINPSSGIKNNKEKITLIGAGWGHGVGLCQIGALGMALSGMGYEEILRHYFTSTEITKLYD